jgi:hypothetical protein
MQRPCFIVINTHKIGFYFVLWKYLAICTNKKILFLFQCANMVSLIKGNIYLPLLVLWAFYKQKVAVALQRAQISSTLRWTSVTNKAFSKLGVIWRFFHLFLFDLLYVIGDGFRTRVWDLDLDRCLYFPFIFECHIGFGCWSSLCVLPFPFWIGVFFIQFIYSYFHLSIQQDFLLPCLFDIKV